MLITKFIHLVLLEIHIWNQRKNIHEILAYLFDRLSCSISLDIFIRIYRFILCLSHSSCILFYFKDTFTPTRVALRLVEESLLYAITLRTLTTLIRLGTFTVLGPWNRTEIHSTYILFCFQYVPYRVPQYIHLVLCSIRTQ